MKLLIKLSTRSRPDKMFKCISNIRAMALEPDPWIIVSMDLNDPSCNNPRVALELAQIKNVFPFYGYSRNKIDAFNRDVPADGWDIIIATSDDISFTHGFDMQIKRDAVLFYKQRIGISSSMHIDPAHFNLTIWYGDGAEHGKIMTVPIMSKLYYERLGYIYNPAYISFFCDEEAIHVGENLGRIFYSKAEIFEHLHPAWAKAEWDQQYKMNNKYYPIDKITFGKRKALNFPI